MESFSEEIILNVNTRIRVVIMQYTGLISLIIFSIYAMITSHFAAILMLMLSVGMLIWHIDVSNKYPKRILVRSRTIEYEFWNKSSVVFNANSIKCAKLEFEDLEFLLSLHLDDGKILYANITQGSMNRFVSIDAEYLRYINERSTIVNNTIMRF